MRSVKQKLLKSNPDGLVHCFCPEGWGRKTNTKNEHKQNEGKRAKNEQTQAKQAKTSKQAKKASIKIIVRYVNILLCPF